MKSWPFTIAEMGLPNIFPDVIPKEKDPLEYPEEVGEDYEEEPSEYDLNSRHSLCFYFHIWESCQRI